MASIPTTTMRIEPREQGLPFEVKKETSNGR